MLLIAIVFKRSCMHIFKIPVSSTGNSKKSVYNKLRQNDCLSGLSG